jgi:peroxiredoxin Q/BCP
MAQLRQDYSQFAARDIEVVVVGPEDAKAFATYFVNESLPFIGLPDPKASVLKRYGQEVNLFKLGRMPAQVLIDKAGVARYVHYGHNMSDIPKNEELLALGDEINRSQADRATTVTLQSAGAGKR